MPPIVPSPTSTRRSTRPGAASGRSEISKSRQPGVFSWPPTSDSMKRDRSRLSQRRSTPWPAEESTTNLAGGFSRYSVDERWLVPHFEKMLYDNAQLVRLYTHAYQVTGNTEYERIVRETLDYIAREMTSPEGGFYSAQDADSEGIEGKFFVWTEDEVDQVLGAEDGEKFRRAYGVSAEGNFHDPHHPELTGRNVLTNRFDADVLADELAMPREELVGKLDAMRTSMFNARHKRIYPGLDDKILASWNGLMLAAISEAAASLTTRRGGRPPSTILDSCARRCGAKAGCCTPTKTARRVSAACSRTTHTSDSDSSSSTSSRGRSVTCNGPANSGSDPNVVPRRSTRWLFRHR